MTEDYPSLGHSNDVFQDVDCLQGDEQLAWTDGEQQAQGKAVLILPEIAEQAPEAVTDNVFIQQVSHQGLLRL